MGREGYISIPIKRSYHGEGKDVYQHHQCALTMGQGRMYINSNKALLPWAGKDVYQHQQGALTMGSEGCISIATKRSYHGQGRMYINSNKALLPWAGKDVYQ